MYIDAAALVAILCNEEEADRCSAALARASNPVTSAISVWEAAMALAKPEKLGLPVEASRQLVMSFVDDRGIELVNLPQPIQAVELALLAAQRYRGGHNRLNLADCFHYACARSLGLPILSTAQEFRMTDLDVVA